ncbi:MULTISPECIES: enoyl-CoA hydratase [Aeromonas]|uniref:enoyl-CoA hydratase n=1 Tax=Aeromonas TaxID=642 RepID=UPI001459F854|nr:MULTISPECIES: enoyl-CoA hydratase [Aeromonas]MBF4801036.1 enoyl-CoA hydratase [Aeromonas hydrophila]NME02196.1 enoyl-CoA hydratase [Aeromonas sp. DNRA1]
MTRIRLEYHGHVAYITLDHPPANTWTLASLQAFLQMMVELDSRPDVVALVIRGAGDKFFCAGADLNMFADGNLEHAREVAEAFGRAFEALARFHGVSIAAINGYAMGGGLEVALACDIRIAEQQAKLGLPEASVGLLPCAGGTQRLTELVGPGWAKRMILCGEKVSATLAYEMGLVEEVVKEGHAWEAAHQMAQLVERQSPSALRACKQLINQGRSSHRDAALPLERSLFLTLFDDANQREGVTAFLEKRAPRWHYDQSKPVKSEGVKDE